MKLYNYISAFALTVFSSTLSAQTDITVLEQGKKIDYEGNTANELPIVIGEHAISDIQKISFDNKNMYVATATDTASYEIANVHKVKVSGTVEMQSAYIPASMAKRLNFDDEKNWSIVHDSNSDYNHSIGAQQSVSISFTDKGVTIVNTIDDLVIKDSANTVVVVNNAGSCDITLSGKAVEKKIVLSGKSTTRFVLNGVELTTDDDASIISSSSSRMYVNTAKGTFNSLSGIEATDGCGELMVSGEGNLLLSGKRDYSALLSAKKKLTINGGAISIVARGFAEQGIASDNEIEIFRGLINVVTLGGSEDDGDAFNVETSAVAITAGQTLTIEGGKINIKSIGGTGAVGLASKNNVEINGGDLCMMSFDDCIKASTSVVIKGGRVFCTSVVDDGIDSGSLIDLQGGVVSVFGPYPQEGAFDNNGKTFSIGAGCTLIAAGTKSDSPWADKSTQSSLLVKKMPADKYISVKDAAGNELVAFETPNHPTMTLVISTPSVVPNAKYSVYGYPTCESGLEYMSIIDKGVFKNGKLVTTVTASGHK